MSDVEWMGYRSPPCDTVHPWFYKFPHLSFPTIKALENRETFLGRVSRKTEISKSGKRGEKCFAFVISFINDGGTLPVVVYDHVDTHFKTINNDDVIAISGARYLALSASGEFADPKLWISAWKGAPTDVVCMKKICPIPPTVSSSASASASSSASASASTRVRKRIRGNLRFEKPGHVNNAEISNIQHQSNKYEDSDSDSDTVAPDEDIIFSTTYRASGHKTLVLAVQDTVENALAIQECLRVCGLNTCVVVDRNIIIVNDEVIALAKRR